MIMAMVGCMVCMISNAANKTMSDEEISALVDEKVNAAVAGASSQMQSQIDAQNQAIAEAQNSDSEKGSNGVGMIAAAIATGLACIGSGIAVAVVASSAVGAISEDPSLLGKTIILAGLAEGIAIYGLIISIMILNKI
ncbi:MAG: ATP synthase subunit C [Clostridia bacterium]|nr:ATP synthase subunit C [Clostridia bacterium]